MVDDNNKVLVYSLQSRAVLYQDKNANSVAWNTEFEDMLCFSGGGKLSTKTADFPVHQQKMQVGLSNTACVSDQKQAGNCATICTQRRGGFWPTEWHQCITCTSCTCSLLMLHKDDSLCIPCLVSCIMVWHHRLHLLTACQQHVSLHHGHKPQPHSCL